jgi:putative aminopeptidase FrvX
MDEIELMLKELTEASGVSGYEAGARALMRRYFSGLGELSQDKLGSLMCTKTGSGATPRVLMAGHMDEIGFMVRHITKEGFIKFTTLGGWSAQVLGAQRVTIQTNKGEITGVINSRPPFIMTDEERRKATERKDMFIDIGATSEQEVTDVGVRIGDPVVPVSQFTILSVPKKTYMAKAFDDRMGNAVTVAVLQNLLRENHPNTVIAVATVQEEVGTRGAITCVECINPDVAIVLDVDVAGDTPGVKPEESANKFGGGPTVLAYDVRMIPNVKLRDLVMETAKEINTPVQVSAIEFGSTDAGPIHLHKTGVPTIVLGVPTRYVHSHNSILRRDDFDAVVKLATAVTKKLDQKTVAALTEY